MRSLSILSAVFLTAATPVFAQVTVDLHALQALPDHRVTTRPPRSVPLTAPGPQAVAKPEAPVAATQTPAQPAMPETIPDVATITPIAPPALPAGSAPPPPVSDTAATAASLAPPDRTTSGPATSGLRLSFAPDQSDLSADGFASIKQMTQATPPGDATTFNVFAYAPGKPDDPSTARRVSLSRAMAVRNALVADGVPSARIFVRALGEQFGDGPPDRVDLNVTGAPASANTAASR
jgi:outer membrane protein OmpA-like peptidoglycan-associated protein